MFVSIIEIAKWEEQSVEVLDTKKWKSTFEWK